MKTLQRIGRQLVLLGALTALTMLVSMTTGRPFVHEAQADTKHVVYDPVDDWFYCLGTPKNCDWGEEEEGG